MGLKTVAFIALGGTAAYFSANFPLVNSEDIQIHKNFFNSSYTFNMPKEGVTMVFDKRYEKELSLTTEVVQSLVKIADSAKETDKAEAELLKEQANEKIRQALKFR